MFKKENWFKWLFKKEFESLHETLSKMEDLQMRNNQIRNEKETLYRNIRQLEKDNEHLKSLCKKKEVTEEELMRYCLKTLNVPFIDFYNVNDEGHPLPHYLDALPESARKDFVAHMEAMYTDEKFQTIVSYVINLIGNYSMQKAEDDKMKNGKVGIIAIRTLMAEFIRAHQEYVDSKKPVEGFDPLAVLPE